MISTQKEYSGYSARKAWKTPYVLFCQDNRNVVGAQASVAMVGIYASGYLADKSIHS